MAVKDKLEQEWIILHTAVEGYFKGQVVTLAHLKMGQERDIDTDRLVALGAIAPVDSDEGKAALAARQPGDETPTNVPLTDAVPVPTSVIAEQATPAQA